MSNPHSHFFSFSQGLIGKDRRGQMAAAKPRSVHTYKWTDIHTLDPKNIQKEEKSAEIAAILSKNVTQFLLFNVLDGVIYGLSINAVAMSWGNLASGVTAWLRVSLTVTNEGGTEQSSEIGLENKQNILNREDDSSTCLLYTSPSPRD